MVYLHNKESEFENIKYLNLSQACLLEKNTGEKECKRIEKTGNGIKQNRKNLSVSGSS